MTNEQILLTTIKSCFLFTYIQTKLTRPKKTFEVSLFQVKLIIDWSFVQQFHPYIEVSNHHSLARTCCFCFHIILLFYCVYFLLQCVCVYKFFLLLTPRNQRNQRTKEKIKSQQKFFLTPHSNYFSLFLMMIQHTANRVYNCKSISYHSSIIPYWLRKTVVCANIN